MAGTPLSQLTPAMLAQLSSATPAQWAGTTNSVASAEGNIDTTTPGSVNGFIQQYAPAVSQGYDNSSQAPTTGNLTGYSTSANGNIYSYDTSGKLTGVTKQDDNGGLLGTFMGTVLSLALPEFAPLIMGGATLATGGSIQDALKAGALTYGGQQLMGTMGANGPSDIGVSQTQAPLDSSFDQYLSPTGATSYPVAPQTPFSGTSILDPVTGAPTTAATDYSLASQAPVNGMGGAQGIQSNPNANLADMGGGQGITVNTGNGILSQLGVTPSNSQVVMGDPNSFINDPSVTGVAQQTTDQLSKLDNSGNYVITSTADPSTGDTSTVLTPATLPNNPLADSSANNTSATGNKTTVAGALPSTGAGNTSGTTGALPDTSIPTLVAGLTKSTPLSINPYGVSFAGPVQTGDHLAKGGLVQHFEEGSAVKMPPSAGIWHGNSRVSLTPPHGALSFGPHFAEGGHFTDNEHVPEFYSEGGMHNRYVQGDGDGTSDDVPAMLANGEFVIPADVVSSLGNGSNDSGAKVLDHFLETIRLHKQAHDPKQLPPDSKGALAYLSESYKKARA